MEDVINSVLQGLVDNVNAVVGGIPDLCPFAKPFEEIRTGLFSQYLGYVNYFLPVSEVMAIGFTWSSAIAIYYGVSVGLRWAKAIS